MTTAKVINCPNGDQIIPIPHDPQLDSKYVWIYPVRNGLIARTKPESWDDFFNQEGSMIENKMSDN